MWKVHVQLDKKTCTIFYDFSFFFTFLFKNHSNIIMNHHPNDPRYETLNETRDRLEHVLVVEKNTVKYKL